MVVQLKAEAAVYVEAVCVGAHQLSSPAAPSCG